MKVFSPYMKKENNNRYQLWHGTAEWHLNLPRSETQTNSDLIHSLGANQSSLRTVVTRKIFHVFTFVNLSNIGLWLHMSCQNHTEPSCLKAAHRLVHRTLECNSFRELLLFSTIVSVSSSGVPCQWDTHVVQCNPNIPQAATSLDLSVDECGCQKMTRVQWEVFGFQERHYSTAVWSVPKPNWPQVSRSGNCIYFFSHATSFVCHALWVPCGAASRF